MSDADIKRARVLGILDEVGADSVLLSSAASVGWYLEGARTHVSLAAAPIVAVEVSRHADTVYLTTNESARLVAEELPGHVRVVERLWFEPPPRARGLDESDIEPQLRAARQAFLPEESGRFSDLGRDVAVVATDILSTTTPRVSERALAALIAGELVARGADPLVVLVAGEARLAHRHALPTAGLVGRRALVTLCARRDGLIVNLSRWVQYGPLTPAERDSEERIRLVEADMFEATRPGERLCDILAVAARSYHRNGFDQDEWRRHHQGGPAGYAGRDPRATPDSTDRVVVGQHFSWNPSALGAKIEDTVVLTPTGIDPITVDPRWPTVIVNGIARPIGLEL